MATITVQYAWPEGGTLAVSIKAKVRNPEALADMRIEAKRLWGEAIAALEPAAPEPAVTATD